MMPKRRSVVTLAWLTVVAVLVTACGGSDSGSLGAAPTGAPPAASPPPTSPTPDASPSSAPSPDAPAGTPATSAAPRPSGGSGGTPTTPARTLTLELWFIRDGKLFPTMRTIPATLATSRAVLTELSAGPSSAEGAAGVRTGLASGLSFDVSIADGIADVDLPQSFYDGGRDAARLRQAQVVYSLTQFPTVSAVSFRADGETLGPPVRRADYEDLLPPIVVTSVVIGQEIRSPVRVAGTANVFEATVSIRILDADGDPVATTFTTATCGTGCRGDYSVAVSFRTDTRQAGRLQVYEVSAKDGSRINVVDIPVILLPTG